MIVSVVTFGLKQLAAVTDAIANHADALSQNWRNAAEDGSIDLTLGPIRVLSQSRQHSALEAAFNLGRDHGRSEVGLSRVPRPQHLRPLTVL